MSILEEFMASNTLNFDDFADRYFKGEEFFFMFKNLSLRFKIIDGANVLEYSDGFKVKYMPLKTKEHLYHVTMNNQSILDFWNNFIYIEK